MNDKIEELLELLNKMHRISNKMDKTLLEITKKNKILARYDAEVKRWGGGAHILSKKKWIGCKAKVMILDEEEKKNKVEEKKKDEQ